MTDALLHPLKERYRDDSNVYVSGNLFLYYEEGDPSAVVAPAVFVVGHPRRFGVPGHRRRIYKLWEESRAPDVVFELTSEHTYRTDGSLLRLYDPELGRCLLTRFEETEARRRAEARAEAAEAELARLRAQLEQQEN